MESEHVYHPLEKLQQRDQIKQTLAAKNDITLITIPFWWDGKADRYKNKKDTQIIIITND